MSEASKLGRDLSLTDVVGLGINGVIGSGIFLLPGLAADRLGPASILSIAAAGFLSILIGLCFAEVGSQFRSTGGPYVYARRAFGNFFGFGVGWMTCVVAITSWAALSNAFTTALAHFIPALEGGWVKSVVLVSFLAVLSLINALGAKLGAIVSNVFTAAKLVPLAVFIVVGIFVIDLGRFEPFAPKGFSGFPDATLTLLYAYVGFEALVVPAGEMKNPARAVPLALIMVLGISSVVYMGVLAVSIGTLDGIAGHPNPVAAAGTLILGDFGGQLIAAGIVVSVFGVNAASALVSPRRFYALAERGDLPAFLSKIHPTRYTPVWAIALTFTLTVPLALSGSFKELAMLSVIARFLQYIPTCLAVFVFRANPPIDQLKENQRKFVVSGGAIVPALAILLCCGLVLAWFQGVIEKEQWRGLAMVAGAIALSLPLYWSNRRRASAREHSLK